MIQPKKSGRPSKNGDRWKDRDRRTVIGFSLTPNESELIDQLVTKLGLDGRSAVIRWLIKQELAR